MKKKFQKMTVKKKIKFICLYSLMPFAWVIDTTVNVFSHLYKKRKPALASLLAMVMVFSMLPFTALPVSAAEWNGSTSPITSGNGTAASPYLVETAEQLAYVAQRVNASDSAYRSACYKLTQDITLNSSISTSSKEWTPIGASGGFSGAFDGNNKTIYGLYISQGTSGIHGLFGKLDGATVRNVKVSSSSLTANASVGLIAGMATDSVISGCIASADCVVTNPGYPDDRTFSGFSGGIVGAAYGTTTISSCQFAGSISGEMGIGGIVGYADYGADVTVSNCVTRDTAIVKGNLHVGGIVGESYAKLIMQSCGNAAAVDGMTNVGGILGWATENTEGRIVSCNNWGKITGRDAYQIPGSEGKRYSKNAYGSDATFWTLEGPVAGIAGSTKTALYSCQNFGVIEGESEIGTVAGIAGTATLVAGCANNSAVTGCRYAVGIAGTADKIVECTNAAKITANMQISNGCAAGIAYSAGYIAYCKNSGEVRVNYDGSLSGDPDRIGLLAGGIALEVIPGSKLVGCYNSGNVYGVKAAGGIVGVLYKDGSVESCVNTAAVEDKNYAAGGIVGVNMDGSGGIRSCLALQSVKGKQYSGGIVGLNLFGGVVPANNFYKSGVAMTGTVTAGGTPKTADEIKAPAFAAELGDFFYYNYSTFPQQKTEMALPKYYEGVPYKIYTTTQLRQWSTLSQTDNVYKWMPALLMEDMYLYDSAWTPILNYKGTMDGNGKTIYGLTVDGIGDYQGLFSTITEGAVKNLTIADAYVKGNSFVGTICGLLSGTAKIQNCSIVNSTVIAKDSAAGGIVGGAVNFTDLSSEITACSSNANVTAVNYAGGIAGLAICRITDCRSTASVSGSIAGGIVGHGDMPITNCYYAGSAMPSAPICAKIGTMPGYQNNYYLSDTETDSFDFTTAKSAEQFASGEVCYLLNGSTSVGTLVWGQVIDKAGENPQAAPVFSGETVYQGYTACNAQTPSYSNTLLSQSLPEHTYGAWTDNSDGTHIRSCTVCGATQTATHTCTAYTDNGDGTHSGTCTACGYKDTKGQHIDANTDYICDMCNAVLPNPFEVGDVNIDGAVDYKDLYLLKDYLQGLSEFTALQRKLADLNGDTEVQSKDFLILQRLVLTFTSDGMPNAEGGKAYSAQVPGKVAGADGTAESTAVYSSTDLPAGLTMSESGLITGSFSATGIHSFTVTITISNGTYTFSNSQEIGLSVVEPADDIISVTITWGAMEFTYTDASEGTWNPTSCTYENATDAGWTCNADANKITVISESNVNLTASFDYKKADGVSVTGSFTDGTNPVTDALPLAKKTDTAQTVVVYLKLDGKPTESQTSATLGTVTVTITDSNKKSGFVTIDGNTYFFNADGSRQTVWYLPETGERYFFDLEGVMLQTCWLEGGFYFGDDGKMITGWQQIWDDMYYFSKSQDDYGKKVIGWLTIDGDYYYFDVNGIMAHDVTIDGRVIGPDGKVVQ